MGISLNRTIILIILKVSTVRWGRGTSAVPMVSVVMMPATIIVVVTVIADVPRRVILASPLSRRWRRQASRAWWRRSSSVDTAAIATAMAIIDVVAIVVATITVIIGPLRTLGSIVHSAVPIPLKLFMTPIALCSSKVAIGQVNLSILVMVDVIAQVISRSLLMCVCNGSPPWSSFAGGSYHRRLPAGIRPKQSFLNIRLHLKCHGVYHNQGPFKLWRCLSFGAFHDGRQYSSCPHDVVEGCCVDSLPLQGGLQGVHDQDATRFATATTAAASSLTSMSRRTLAVLTLAVIAILDRSPRVTRHA